jgi:sortase (surface protein transpeptidase)
MSDIAPRSPATRPILRRFAERRTINDVYRKHRQSAAAGPAATVSTSTVQPPVSPQVVNVPPRSKVPTKPALPRQHRSLVLKRQIVDRAAHRREEANAQRKRTLLAFAFGGVAASLLFGVGFMAYMLFREPAATPSATATRATLGATTAKGEVSEQVVSMADIKNYRVATDAPRVLIVPKLGIHARIKPVETNLNNEPLTADNIHDVGWLTAGAVPGNVGAALINGHTSGLTKPGVFANLAELAVGDLLQVERGDGTISKFKVIRSKAYPANNVDMREALTPVIAGKNGLNLLTNMGRYNARTNQFEQRTVIFAIEQ